MIVHHCSTLFYSAGVRPYCVDTVTGVTDWTDLAMLLLLVVSWLVWVLWPVVQSTVQWLQDGDTLQVMSVLYCGVLLVTVWIMAGDLEWKESNDRAV